MKLKNAEWHCPAQLRSALYINTQQIYVYVLVRQNDGSVSCRV